MISQSRSPLLPRFQTQVTRDRKKLRQLLQLAINHVVSNVSVTMLLLCVCMVLLLLLNKYVQPFFLASRESNIAIIGAGVIGLCTAYQLARESHCTTHRVVVFDATDDVFAASSCTNIGILSGNEFQDDLVPLGR